jgi:hypothetical protein
MSFIRLAAFSASTGVLVSGFQTVRTEAGVPSRSSSARATSPRSAKPVVTTWPPSSLDTSDAPASIAASSTASGSPACRP